MMHGWRFARSDRDVDRVGKTGYPCSERWTKGECEVFLVNESEYQGIGEYEVAVCGDTEHDVMDFLRDFGKTSCFVVENDAVYTLGP